MKHTPFYAACLAILVAGCQPSTASEWDRARQAGLQPASVEVPITTQAAPTPSYAWAYQRLTTQGPCEFGVLRVNGREFVTASAKANGYGVSCAIATPGGFPMPPLNN
ncbi:hypothetical protein KIKIMORA_00150 [Brevundimonas phage vB_BpoS-Kikimora]|uniref:Lipoprotein n=1 Tax=Brevundimonas phage vB_BpoS-Kikimora TaxID=2948601 RepID=A0A9E7SMP4_9CAUD|nr:hypothetical protein KIKIMORA_00150 [Brevundimonas phage vB_BpoS-Kikimora]